MGHGMFAAFDVAFGTGVEVFGFQIPMAVIAVVVAVVALLAVVLIIRVSRRGKKAEAPAVSAAAPKHMKQ